MIRIIKNTLKQYLMHREMRAAQRYFFTDRKAISTQFSLNYFDLGAHTGQEIEILMRQFDRAATSDLGAINIFAIEPHPVYFQQLVRRFSNHGIYKACFWNIGVSSREGVQKLHVHPNSLGHSLYQDKSGVTQAFVPTISMRLSTLLHDLPKSDHDINVLKANIEGAEIDVLEDLESHSLLGYFDFYLGSAPGKFSDIAKVTSLREAGKVEQADRILRKESISILKFSHANPQWQNVDLRMKVEEEIERRKKLRKET